METDGEDDTQPAAPSSEEKTRQIPKTKAAHYIIKPWVGPYYLSVALTCEAARALLARMDFCKRIEADGIHHVEFEQGCYVTKWLDHPDVPPCALSLFNTDYHLRLVRAGIPTGSGAFARYAREQVFPGVVGWSEWWADHSAEYAESNPIPRVELERVARSDFSDNPLFPEASW
jgi:hypothetical protein